MNSLFTFFQCVGLGAVFIAALFYFGFGATRFLLPRAFWKWRVWITPFVGIALIIVWDYLALFFGLNLTTATFALLIIAIIVNAIAIRQIRVSRQNFSPRAVLLETPLAIACVTFLVSIAPLVRYGYLTIIGENWDYEFYLPLADALQKFSTSALAQAPTNPLLNVILSRHIAPLPMGFAYLQSSLDVLFKLEAFDSFTILLATLHALSVISAFVLFRTTLKMSPRTALAAAALLGLNGLLLWVTYWNYGLHLASLALLPIAIALGAHVLLTCEMRTLPIITLFLAALNVTFHPTLIAALLPLGALGIYTLSVRPNRARTLTIGLGLIALTTALSFPALFHINDFLREYYGRTPLATGLRDFVPLSDVYGLSQYTLDFVVGHNIPTPALYEIATCAWNLAAPPLLVLALAASAFALWQLRYNREYRVVWYILIGTSIFYVAIFRLPFLHPYPYGFLKSLTLVSYVIIALAVKGISELRFPVLHSALCILFLGATLFTCTITLEQYFKPAPPFFNADDLQTRAVAPSLPRGATVFLTDRREVQKIPLGLAAYALREFPLFGNVQTGYGTLNNATTGAVYDYALLARGEDPATRGYQNTPLWSNQKFALYPKTPGVIYHRALDTYLAPANTLTVTLGANTIVTGTQTVSSTVVTRDVHIALASFVTQTAMLTFANTTQTIALAPGLSIYQIPQMPLPNTVTLTAPSELFVPWIELREAGVGQTQILSTHTLLVRCENVAALNVRCATANPGQRTLRWEYVVRGIPKGMREEQELVRHAAIGNPQQAIEIGADSIGFDTRAPQRFAAPQLPNGNYYATLEIFAGDILSARIDLYKFTQTKEKTSLASPASTILTIVQP